MAEPQAPTPAPKPPKLRSSCDGCGTAKVKCDRGRPECRRCITLGLTCVYKQSRKFGKPPRKRPSVNLEAAASKKHTVCSAQGHDNNTIMGARQPQSISKSSQLTNILSLPSTINTTSNINGHKDQSVTCHEQLQNGNEISHQNFPDLAPYIPPVPLAINSTLRTYEQNQFGWPVFNFDEWPQIDTFTAEVEIPSVPRASAQDRRCSFSAIEPASDTHSCPRSSYEILRDLVCPSDLLHAPESNSDADTVWATVDQVLHCNRTAIDRLSQLLRCPCAKSGHRVMLHASIVSRILIWYQQAAGWTESTRGHALASTKSGSISSFSPAPSETVDTDTTIVNTTPPSLLLAQSTGFAVAHVPVSMGTFNIEDQDMQAGFRNQLVLSELKKTASLINLFMSQDSGDGMGGLYSCLGAWLKSEYERTVRILKSRIREVNGDLDV